MGDDKNGRDDNESNEESRDDAGNKHLKMTRMLMKTCLPQAR